MMVARHVQPHPTLGSLLQGAVALNDGYAQMPVSGLCLDSRGLRAGDVFLACRGTRQHGLAYLDQALSRGAVAVLYEPAPGVEALVPADGSVPMIAVPGLSAWVGVIADRFYGQPSRAMTVFGVTGTDGKTSVSQFLAQALDQESARCAVLGTLGYGLWGELSPASHTTPDAISLQAELARVRDLKARWLSMEVSSHALDQGRVNGVAFDQAIFTNLSRDHLDYHGSIEAYSAAKRRLFEWPGLDHAIINLDDPFGRALAGGLQGPQILGYGLGAVADYAREVVTLDGLELHEDGIRARVLSPWGEGELEAPVLGRFNAQNLLAVTAALLALGIDLREILLRLRKLQTVPGRMEPVRVSGGPLAVIDYAHTPAALEHVLSALRGHCRGRLFCVFGCGGDRDRGKRPLMAGAAERGADRVIVTDDNPRHENPDDIVQEIMAGFVRLEAVSVQRDRAAAIAMALEEADADDVVLIAGKGHEDYQLYGDERMPFSDRAVVAAVLGAGGPREVRS